MEIIVIILIFLLVLSLCGWSIVTFGAKKIKLTRSFVHKTVYAGTQVEMIETVENDHLLIVPWLRVETRIPSSLQFGKIENLSIRSEMYHRSVFSLMPYQKIIRHHRVTARHRGVFQVGHAAITFGDITGFFRKTVELENDGLQLIVFPALLQEQFLPESVFQKLKEIAMQRSLLTDPFLVRGLRDYQPGDPIRDIHWNATAKTQIVQVKVHDWNHMPRLLVVINSQTRDDQWADLMDYEQEIVERVISAAATCCIQAILLGIETGFATNMPYFQENEFESAVYPFVQRGNEEELLHAFSRLLVKRTKRFPTFIKELKIPQETCVLIVSSYISDSIQVACSELENQGFQTSLYVVDGEKHV